MVFEDSSYLHHIKMQGEEATTNTDMASYVKMQLKFLMKVAGHPHLEISTVDEQPSPGRRCCPGLSNLERCQQLASKPLSRGFLSCSRLMQL